MPAQTRSSAPLNAGSYSLTSPEPDDDAGEVDEDKEARGVLVEAGEDLPEVPELADEALDQVALPVGGGVESRGTSRVP